MDVVIGILGVSSFVAVATSIYFGFSSDQFDKFTTQFLKLKRNSQVSRLTTIIGCLWLVSVAVIIIWFIILITAPMP
jgi:hypothetical protein